MRVVDDNLVFSELSELQVDEKEVCQNFGIAKKDIYI